MHLRSTFIAPLLLIACLPKNESRVAHSADPCSGHDFSIDALDARCTVSRAERGAPPAEQALEIDVREQVNPIAPGVEKRVTVEIKNVSEKVVPLVIDDDPQVFRATFVGASGSSLEGDAGSACGKGPGGELARVYLAPDGIFKGHATLKASKQKVAPGCVTTDVAPLAKGDYTLEIVLPIRETSGSLRKFSKKVRVGP